MTGDDGACEPEGGGGGGGHGWVGLAALGRTREDTTHRDLTALKIHASWTMSGSGPTGTHAKLSWIWVTLSLRGRSIQ